MNIFITNDDGIEALGIQALARCMTQFGKVYVVAPDKEYSGMARSITLRKPLTAKKYDLGEKIEAYSLTGSPTDCVKIGIEGIFKDVQFDLLLSGVNRGPNLGTDVFYSGTVSAALEGLYQQIKSIALSYCSFEGKKEDYEKLCQIFTGFLQDYLERQDKIGDFILNINFPENLEEANEFVMTSLGNRDYENVIDEKEISKDVLEYIIGGEPILEEEASDSDVWRIRENKITVTPVYNCLYAPEHFEHLKNNW